MLAIDARYAGGVIAAFALAASVPLGKALGRWSDHRLRSAESFAAGAALAYAIADLMVELTAIGGTHVHAMAARWSG
jgi:hypothetical protein